MGGQVAWLAGERANMKAVLFPRIIVLSLSLFMLFCLEKKTVDATQGDSMGKAFQQAKLEKEGRALLRQGLYDKALIKFLQADDPALKLKGFQDTVAKGLIRETYYLKGEYEKALEALNPLVQMNPTQWNWQNEKTELEAIIKTRDSGSAEAVRQFIEYMGIKYKDILPPRKYDINITTTVASAIVRSYDQIGDYDGGVAFVDSVIKYDETGKAGKTAKKYARTMKNPYFQVRIAFEQDKQEGKKGCMGQPGCVGRATKALIQSEYFPW